MGDWNPQVFPRTVGRGDALTVQIGVAEQFRGVRVELVLIERKLKGVLNETFNNERIVASASWVPGEASIVLPVPGWLPDSYSGETIAWEYEARVVGDQFGRDARRAFALVVHGGVATDVGADGFTDAREGGPMNAAGAIGRTSGKAVEVIAALFVIGMAIPPLYFGLTVPSGVALGFGLVLAAFAAYILVWTFFQKARAIDGIELDVPETVFRPGQSIDIVVQSKPDSTVEIGIEAIEMYTRRTRNHVKVNERTTVLERYVPFTQQTNRIPTLPDDPNGYAGEEVSLTWAIGVRRVDTEPKKRHSETRRFAIAKIA